MSLIGVNSILLEANQRGGSQMLDSQRQVEQLTVKLEALMQEKSKLESRNCVLEKVCYLICLDLLFCGGTNGML